MRSCPTWESSDSTTNPYERLRGRLSVSQPHSSVNKVHVQPNWFCFLKFSKLRNSAWDFFGFCWKPLGFLWVFDFCPHLIIPITQTEVSPLVDYPASRGFSLVFLSVVLPFSSRFWLLAFCFGCFCAEEKTSADSRLGFLLSMRIRYLQDLGGNHMTKPVVQPVLSTRASFLY